MKLINKTLVTATSLMTVLSIVSTASAQQENPKNSFRSEVEFSYVSFDYDKSDIELGLTSLSAEVFLTDVKIKGQPYAEAAFLQRIASAGLILGKFKVDYSANDGADGTAYGLSVNYMMPGSPYIIQAAYTNVDTEQDRPSSYFDSNSDNYEFSAGYFIADGFSVNVLYNHSQADYSMPVSSEAFTFKTNEYGFFTKYVKSLEAETAINVDARLMIEDAKQFGDTYSNTILDVSADYYFNHRISLGGGLLLNRGDQTGDEGNELSVQFKGFINPQFAGFIELNKFSADNSNGDDNNTVTVGLTSRF